MNIEYNIQIWRSDNQCVAHAMPLDIMSSGLTPAEARHALYEAVDLFFETSSEMGTLGDILQDLGYEQRDGSWVGPAWIALERHSTEVTA